MSESGKLSLKLIGVCEHAGLMVATAESCTGGMIAAAITDIAGSSSVFDRGFVTYSNAAKTAMLGVSDETLAAHGAVSKETAVEMAEGALSRSDAGLAVSVTGVAGPGGGSPEKPVGLVHMAVASKFGTTRALVLHFGAIGRDAVRRETVKAALQALLHEAQRL